jgi:signal transduction histidine kinase
MNIPSLGTASRPRSHGLKIMQERAEALERTLKLDSRPGKGTRIEAIIPLPPAEEDIISQEHVP